MGHSVSCDSTVTNPDAIGLTESNKYAIGYVLSSTLKFKSLVIRQLVFQELSLKYTLHYDSLINQGIFRHLPLNLCMSFFLCFWFFLHNSIVYNWEDNNHHYINLIYKMGFKMHYYFFVNLNSCQFMFKCTATSVN